MVKILMNFIFVTSVVLSLTQAHSFTFVVFPDTQFASTRNGYLDKSVEWIINAAKKTDRGNKKIKFVMHVGDMVLDAKDPLQWINFVGSIKKLETETDLPLMVALGNRDHNYAHVELSSRSETFNIEQVNTSNFETIFPAGLIQNNSSSIKLIDFLSRQKKSLNYCYEFHEGKKSYLVFALSYYFYEVFKEEGIDWVNRTIKEKKDHKVILLIHDYLYTNIDNPNNNDGCLEVEGETYLSEINGKIIFKEIIKKNRQIFMVICGHVKTFHVVRKIDGNRKVFELGFDNSTGVDQDFEKNGYLAQITVEFEKESDKNKFSVTTINPRNNDGQRDPCIIDGKKYCFECIWTP